MDEIIIDRAQRPEIAPLFLFRWEESQDGYVLLYPEGVVKLNATAGEILKRCTGETTVEQLIEQLQAQFVGPREAVEQGVRKFLEVSHAKGWIQFRA
ncbi:MAG TPA: pyrroloquinoline quinone biosynthesis peptide chaperone PqqD [Burkholderiales bacterium]|nr:pyrroloquinoline quinone biosynthesis peptide chaperone PqqD [Burkholderiales bacterium]